MTIPYCQGTVLNQVQNLCYLSFLKSQILSFAIEISFESCMQILFHVELLSIWNKFQKIRYWICITEIHNVNTKGNIYLQHRHFVVLAELMNVSYFCPPIFILQRWNRDKFEQPIMLLYDFEGEQDLTFNSQSPKSKLRQNYFPCALLFRICSWHEDKHTKQATFGH